MRPALEPLCLGAEGQDVAADALQAASRPAPAHDPRAAAMTLELERLATITERQQERLRGTELNIGQSREALADTGFMDRFLGVSSALEKHLDADQRLALTLTDDLRTLRDRHQELVGWREEFLATEALGQTLEREGRFAEAQTAYHRAQQAAHAFAERSGAVGTAVPHGYRESIDEIARLSGVAAQNATTTETVLKTTQTVVVVAGATIATAGAVPALGLAGAAVAGAATGTGAGIIMTGTENAIATATGQKSGAEAVSDGLNDATRYAQDSLVASVGTVLGIGAAGKVSGALFSGSTAATVTSTTAATTGLNVARSVVAGGTAGTVGATFSTSVAVGTDYVAAHAEFNELAEAQGLTGGNREAALATFMEERGLQAGQIAHRFAVDSTIGLVSGGAGSSIGHAAQGARTTAQRVAAVTAQGGADAVIGVGAAAVQGDLSAVRITEAVGQAVIGNSTGLAAHRTLVDPYPGAIHRPVGGAPAIEAGASPPTSEAAAQPRQQPDTSPRTIAPLPDLSSQPPWEAIPHVPTRIVRLPVQEHGPRLTEGEMQQLRNGPPASVRTDLEPARMADLLNSQLGFHTVAEIDTAIASLPLDRPAAEAAFRVVTQYGSIQQLDVLAAVISEAHGSGAIRLLSDADPSLAGVVEYLGSAKKVLPLASKVSASSPDRSGRHDFNTVILDEVMLHRLGVEPALRESLRNPDVRILAPLGWTGGITPFNAPRLTEVVDRVQAVIRDAGVQRGDSAAVVEARVTATLKGYVEESLRGVAPELTGRVEFIPAARGRGETVAESIAEQLNGRAGISAADLGHLLQQIPPTCRPAAAEAIVRESRVLSHHTLTLETRAHLDRIFADLGFRGIAPEDVTVFIPSQSRSFNLIGLTSAHASRHRLSFTNASTLAAWLESRGSRPTAVVLLDDIAGSGQTMLLERQKAESKVAHVPHQATWVFAPLLSTEPAARILTSQTTGHRAAFVPGEVVPTFRSNSYFRSLDRVDQARYQAALGHLGWEDNGTFIAFPHMAPDNNCILGGLLARHFTLQEGAVKTSTDEQSYHDKILDSETALQSQASRTLGSIRKTLIYEHGPRPTAMQLRTMHENATRACDLVPERYRGELQSGYDEIQRAFRDHTRTLIDEELSRISMHLDRSSAATTAAADVCRELQSLADTIYGPHLYLTERERATLTRLRETTVLLRSTMESRSATGVRYE